MQTSELVDRVGNDFNYHPPSHPAIVELHTSIRECLHGQAKMLAEVLPAGREQALALTKLEEAMFWANAAIARNHSAVLEKAGANPVPCES